MTEETREEFFKDAIYAESDKCPNCGEETPYYDGECWLVDGEEYPQFYGWGGSMTDCGWSTSWSEKYKCTECKTVYYVDTSST
jgi:predicted RNA-binding Zn-ribbon protein involved in translation (DUF1610 family)